MSKEKIVSGGESLNSKFDLILDPFPKEHGPVQRQKAAKVYTWEATINIGNMRPSRPYTC
ncbi:hypothetical protein N7471_002351 [Penicillium samsonianum]|uniref:uncharacterized protein n=1 Tax=Penicillium samsonianum TaxID=1882272 RepID=UPI002548A3EB|nr:uncharacterized protein N7471_002351 [Penicillium samsonianum]KAJ6142898.1 hypothetical protein N7471_002351 [Penicillium samsonianum]